MAAPIPVFHAQIDAQGAVSLDKGEQPQRAAYLHSLAGQKVEIIVRPERKQRTDKASRYYFGIVIAMMSEFTGYEPHELHEVLAMTFLRVEDDPLTGAPRRKRTPKTNSAEFSAYTDQCVRFAATELGIYIPPANEVEAA